MVIQRTWKLQNENLQHSTNNSNSSNSNNSTNNNSSDDSNSSSSSSSKSHNIKYVTTTQMAENILSKLRQRLDIQNTAASSSSEAAMRSLELLRINVQGSFDKEIDLIIKRFMETYFKLALKNIKENLGENVISDDVLQKMSCSLLENAKTQYNIRPNLKPTAAIVIPSSLIQNDQQQTIIKYETILPQANTILLKRSNDNISNEFNGTIVKKPLLQFQQLQPLQQQQIQQQLQQQQQKQIQQQQFQVQQSQNQFQTQSTTQLQQQQQQSQQQQQQQQQQIQQLQHQQQQSQTQQLQQQRFVVQQPRRRQIFWNTANISVETKFLLDVQANQAFGFGTDGRERLASKHPELIRYLPDGQDRDWLVQQKIIPEQNRNSRFLFLIYDEVMKLAQSDLYRNRDNLNLSILNGFKIPNFIIQKMKVFFIDLNIKSRGLITNSYSAMVNTSSTSGSGGSVTSGGSQLRTALLQGSQNVNNNGNSNGSNAANDNDGNATTTTGMITAPVVRVGNSNDIIQQATVSNSVTIIDRPKPKSSSLSSSHATLTALLTNNNGTNSANLTQQTSGADNG